MDFALDLLLRLGLTGAGLAALLLIPIGLPGNWVLVLLAASGPLRGDGWTVLAVVAASAAAAELLEFGAGMGMAARYGAGRSGMLGAFLGSLLGAVLGLPFGGPLLGSLLGAGVGAFAGAVLFEVIFGSRGAVDGLRAGQGALLGVLIGRTGKAALGAFQAGIWLSQLWGLL
ncbi:MAG TPA: DUF456 family protein [Planctomycetota bacterium]